MKFACSGLPRRALAGALFLAASSYPAVAEPSFAPLLGTWGGSGSYKLEDGTSERIKCDAYYTGSGSELGIAVRCAGQAGKIEMRSKLNASGSSLTGTWEERTYNAGGTVTGKLTDNTVMLNFGGGVTGHVHINYQGTSQTVEIETAGTPLKNVTVSLKRE
jgi:hypothetical protein